MIVNWIIEKGLASLYTSWSTLINIIYQRPLKTYHDRIINMILKFLYSYYTDLSNHGAVK